MFKKQTKGKALVSFCLLISSFNKREDRPKHGASGYKSYNLLVFFRSAKTDMNVCGKFLALLRIFDKKKGSPDFGCEGWVKK